LSVCLFVCLFVCLYPINVKTAEPIGPKFVVGHLGTPGKVYESAKYQIVVSIKIRSSLNFWKFWKSTNFFAKIRKLFFFFYDVHKENMFTINLEDGREAPYKASFQNKPIIMEDARTKRKWRSRMSTYLQLPSSNYSSNFVKIKI